MGGPRHADTGAAADRFAYEDPDPIMVAKLIATHGVDAARGRWFWLQPCTLGHLASLGRQRLRYADGTASTAPRHRRRPTTHEQEEAVVADVYALGGVRAAARQHGLHDAFVITLLRERSLTDYPRMSAMERGMKAAATRTARAGRTESMEASR